LTFGAVTGQCAKSFFREPPFPAKAGVAGMRISADIVAAAIPILRTGFRRIDIRVELDMNDKVGLLS
jgi:hypothetical protein